LSPPHTRTAGPEPEWTGRFCVDVVDRFARALALEVSVTDSLKAILPTLREPAAWEACRNTWTTSAEAKTYLERMQKLDASDRTAYMKWANDMNAAVEKSCGREPGAARSEVQSNLRTLPGARARKRAASRASSM
jgi:hypothetical protein